jgi:hypothetical protein
MMKAFLSCSAAAVLFASPGCSWGKVIAGPITNAVNGHAYLLLGSTTWKASEAEAISLGGHLATIRNQDEENWVVARFGAFGGQQRLLWIGLTDTAKKFHFSWSSGESSSYTAWAQGEPNNVGGGEDFVAIYYPNHSQRGRWNDWSDRTEDPIGLPMNGVVEITFPTLHNDRIAAAQPAAIAINPALVITNECGAIKLQWPISASNYLLEATTNLAQPFAMFGYSEMTNHESGMLYVIVTNPCPGMFFRLREQ